MLPRFIADKNRIYEFEVPSSKSIFSRALLLAAFAEDEIKLIHGAYCEDTKAMLSCLSALGIEMKDKNGVLTVHGCGGKLPAKQAELNVRSAGTVARFLPAALAACGGEFRFIASEQMKRRPMGFLTTLEQAGVSFEYEENQESFPFLMHSEGFSKTDFVIDTDVSTQFASGLFLASAAAKKPLSVRLTGNRVNGSYLDMTLSLLNAFGHKAERTGDTVKIFPNESVCPKTFEIEPDVSAACYFYALALLFGVRVRVRGMKQDSLQGDTAFLKLLEARGVTFTATEKGLLADARGVKEFGGFQENFNNFSDQTLTAAALAPFASSPTRLSGISHIRKQESDRIAAIETNLKSLGVPVRTGSDEIEILPAIPRCGVIRSFGDHRVAMAFALTAIKEGNIGIDDPACCKKTFENYFEMLGRIYQKPSENSDG